MPAAKARRQIITMVATIAPIREPVGGDPSVASVSGEAPTAVVPGVGAGVDGIGVTRGAGVGGLGVTGTAVGGAGVGGMGVTGAGVGGLGVTGTAVGAAQVNVL